MIEPHRRSYRLAWLWLAYSVLLLYGSLYPLGNWDSSLGGPASFFTTTWPTHTTRTDNLLNLLVYLPFGFLAMLTLSGNVARKLLFAAIAGALLSASLELGQTYSPDRVSSPFDILLNTAGSLLGAMIAGLGTSLPLTRRIYQGLRGILRNPASGLSGMLALCLWAVSQCAPLIPSLDMENIRTGLAPVYASMENGPTLDLALFTNDLLMLLGVCTIAMTALSPGRAHSRWIALALLTILAAKLVIVGRSITFEALLAAGCVIACLPILQGLRISTLRLLAVITLSAFYSYSALLPAAADMSLRAFNWVPLRGHISSTDGIFSLLELIWVFMALACALPDPRKLSRRWRIAQDLMLLAAVSVLEWSQKFIPGRQPDITDVMVAVAVWWLVSRRAWQAGITSIPVPGWSLERQNRTGGQGPTAIIPFGAMLIVMVVAVTLVNQGSTEQRRPYALPAIDLLPDPVLPGFRKAHPRLPAPTAVEIKRISDLNPAFWARQHKAALAGDLYSRILMALVEPESAHLQQLHRDLLRLQPTGRGHVEGRPLALGYDWLYEHWNAQQRQQLLKKVEQACQYLVHIIRDKYALSPYNASLYNSPLQALMMTALASHGETTDHDCMRFTADYWKNRVIPVWRQVMGKNGGWHEGGDYLGIGIGQAIYQLPALWRHATAEDLFASEQGIRGFLDFAVYRTRPDGTPMRLGDAAFFNRNIPDLAALAAEYRHSPAYTLAEVPARLQPLARPWGPLAQPSLYNPTAQSSLPLQRYFDGIGLLVARSDWSRDAIWVTFKAGNNYWSHSHLDQGAFTIFRGGALAIDSGLHGTSAGSAHHMNYSYQTIAHNVITVTDPTESTITPPRKRGGAAYEIANDGGQRRVGSGWGRPAPLDYLHWLQEEDHYRTVGDRLWNSEQDVIWKVANLTPAYANRHSGKGDFAERAKRVSDYQRSFIYLRAHGLVVVYDRVESTDPGFPKKWLLHSLNEPQLKQQTFELKVSADPVTGMTGGRLRGQVLLPRDPVLQTIGGPGLELVVDDSNYDEDGATHMATPRRKAAEAGSWRLEVQPNLNNKLDEFLVVMQVTSLDDPATMPQLLARPTVDGYDLVIDDPAKLVLSIPRSLQAITVTSH